MSVGGVVVAGPNRSTAAGSLHNGFWIRENIDGTPDTTVFRLKDAAVQQWDEVKIGLDGLADNDLIFAGVVTKPAVSHPTDENDFSLTEVSAVGFEFLLNQVFVNRRYVGQSATDIVEDLMDDFAPDFTYTGLEASLPTIDEISFTNEKLTNCLDRIVKRIGGNWVLAGYKDLQLGLDILTGGVGDIGLTGSQASQIVRAPDISQVRTRVLMEGGGSNVGAEIAAGSSVLPVRDAMWYSLLGGQVACGPQRITYATKVDGLGGALVGTNVTPASAVLVALAGGSGVTTGAHKYKQTYVTGAGETLPGPESAEITTGGTITAPTAPSATKVLGGNLSAGVYSWKVTYYDAAGGETTPSSASSNVTMDDVSAPTGTPSVSIASGDADMSNGPFKYKYTFRTSDGNFETLPSPESASQGINNDPTNFRVRCLRSSVSTPPAGAGEPQFYRAEWNGSGYDAFKRMAGGSDGFGADDASYYYETSSSGPPGTLGPNAPSSNTMIYRRATVAIPTSSNPATVGRKLYRTVAGGSTWKLVDTIANNTATSYPDNIADGSLGADAPSSNTTALSRVNVTGVSAGPTGTTGRKLYRTEAGGSTYKLVNTFNDNTTTTFLDTVADGSLGATAPVTDTSGLVQESGNVNAGSTSLLVTNPGAFESAGGWAYVGALPIKYTGKSASALTGVPASGDGSISTTLRYGAVIVAAPMLIGIATSGEGSIQYALAQGEPVNLVVTANDAAAQAALAARIGGDGVLEEYLQDNRLSETEALDRATARLTEVKDPLVSLRYRSFDTDTRAGKTVTDTRSGSTTFRIQHVTARFPVAGDGTVIPTYDVEASSRLFTFEQLLRIGSGPQRSGGQW